MANPVNCEVCKASIPLDGAATVAIDRTRYACRSCLNEADSATLERLLRKSAPAPASTASPSPATVAMCRALADKLTFTAPTSAELVVTLIARSLEALRRGDFVSFASEQFAIAEALSSVKRALEEAESTARAIETLDPSYHSAVVASSRPLAIRFIRRKMSGLESLELVKRCLVHKLECNVADCVEHDAYAAELKSRGLEVPK